jgi:hypothetical protein
VLSYTVTVDVPWLTVDTASGAAGTDVDEVAISYAPYTLVAGTHSGTITVSGQQPGVTSAVLPVTVVITPPSFAFCDFDTDGDVDAEDFGKFQTCLTGPGNPQADLTCAGARLDDDDDVDQVDVGRFINCLGGAGVMVNPSCSDP